MDRREHLKRRLTKAQPERHQSRPNRLRNGLGRFVDARDKPATIPLAVVGRSGPGPSVQKTISHRAHGTAIRSDVEHCGGAGDYLISTSPLIRAPRFWTDSSCSARCHVHSQLSVAEPENGESMATIRLVLHAATSTSHDDPAPLPR